MKIAISAETAIDLTKDLIKQWDFKIVPFTIHLGDKSGYDGDITTDEIINYVNETKILPKTSAVNEYQYDEHFSNLLKDYDAVVHFTISSKISSANMNAQNSAKKFKNVYIIDTLNISSGIALLAMYAKDLVDAGEQDPEVVYKKSLARVPYVQMGSELKRLDYLYKGGRCSSLIYFGANLLKIRPQIIVKDGIMTTGKKYRGNFNRVVRNYCEDVLKSFDKPDLKRAFVVYTTAEPDIVEMAKQYLIDRGFEEIYVTRAGGTIASYCGEDCLGISYLNDGDIINAKN